MSQTLSLSHYTWPNVIISQEEYTYLTKTAQKYRSPIEPLPPFVSSHLSSPDDSESDSPDPQPFSSVDSEPNPKFERHAARTVQLCNLPTDTTLAEITSVVRGGLLVDVQKKKETASLSFLHPKDARAFYDYVQTNRLDINGSEVNVRWNDRQYALGRHTARQIRQGACRNFVVRRCNPNIKEQDIINDLEHIHELEIVSLKFIGRDCFISTNSVTSAIFARTCIMSRLGVKSKYRDSLIKWAVDECAQPLHKMPIARSRQAEVESNGAQPSDTDHLERLTLEE
ncbi:hypothetical protein E4U53_007111 [Claviceps sorghi]|nr:hypothetical protein E4U53_007111 [Claviceps sorghi]